MPKLIIDSVETFKVKTYKIAETISRRKKKEEVICTIYSLFVTSYNTETHKYWLVVAKDPRSDSF